MNRHAGRRGRGNPGRGGGGRGPGRSGGYGQDSNLKYNRLYYMISSLLGHKVQVQKENGEVLEGVLSGYNHKKMNIVLEAVHVQELTPPDVDKSTLCTEKDKISEKPLSVSLCSVVHVRVKDVDLTHTTTAVPSSVQSSVPSSVPAFRTDTQISNVEPSELGERELQKWDDQDAGDMDGLTLESTGRMNGNHSWGPEEMFRRNELKYNVQSTYDSSMKEYTTELHQEDTEEYRERERKAEQTAAEIQRCSHSARIDDYGQTEEERYSSVPRDYDSPSRRRKQQMHPQDTLQRTNSSTSEQSPHVESSKQDPLEAVGRSTDHLVDGEAAKASVDGAAASLKELVVDECPVSAEQQTSPADPTTAADVDKNSPTATLNADGNVRNRALEKELREFSEKFVLRPSSPGESQQHLVQDGTKDGKAPTDILSRSSLNPNAIEFVMPMKTPTTPTMAAAQHAALNFTTPAVPSPAIPPPAIPSPAPSSSTSPYSPAARMVRPQQRVPTSAMPSSAMPIHAGQRGPGDILNSQSAGMVTTPMAILPAANPMAAMMAASPPQHHLTTVVNHQLGGTINAPPPTGTPPPPSNFYPMQPTTMMQQVLMPQVSYVLPGGRMVQSPQVGNIGVSQAVAMQDASAAMIGPAGNLIPQSLVQNPHTNFQSHVPLPAMTMASLATSPPQHLAQAHLSATNSLLLHPAGQAGLAHTHPLPNLRQPYGN